MIALDDYILNPLDQFEIKALLSLSFFFFFKLNLTFTNIGLYLVVSEVFIVYILYLSSYFNKIISNYFSVTAESLYETVQSIVISQIDKIKGQKFFPFIYCLFIFILISNLLGMIPYSFTPTSHFVLTFALSFIIVLGGTLLGLIKNGLLFFSLFVPTGCPLGLVPLLVLIEFISYLARNISLGLRLAANILSGHMLLNILSGFTYKMMVLPLSGLPQNYLFVFFSLIPLSFVLTFSGLELAIAFIQSQVFVVLSSSYIKDVISLHS